MADDDVIIAHHAKEHHLSELRIVLLGERWSGKSSAGNTILGREEFESGIRTAQCVKRQGEVAGRLVTLIDTPGWWQNYSVNDTAELNKQEFVRSVSLCPPGPCAFFLVINVKSTFTETERKSVVEHLELLSERVWRHTIVLFTWGDWLGDTTIEQHIETEGRALQELIEKCGKRYHVLNNKNTADGSQVTELLEKIEEMMAEQGGSHYEIDRTLLQEVEEKKREVEERVKQRTMKVQKQRETLRSLSEGEEHHLSELRIVLLGGRASGKSSAGNTILGREEFVSGIRTAQCVKRQGEVAGRLVTVIDTPGWCMGSVNLTTELDKQEIVRSVSLCPPGPCAFFLVINVSSAFTEKKRKSVVEHLELLSERVWRHTIVLFTWGDWLGDATIEQHIETEGRALQDLVEKCGNMYHVLNNKNTADGSQVTELLEKIEVMVAEKGGSHYEINRTLLQEVVKKKRAVEKRVKQRMMKVEIQRKTHRAVSEGDEHHLSELRIVLLGWRQSGKSSAGNTILGREEFESGIRTAQCVKRQGEVAGRLVTVIDTPGLWTTVEDTTELDKQEIVRSVSLCPPGPCAFFLVIKVSSAFSETRRKSVVEHLKLLSERVWRHTIVLFTWGDWLGDTTIEQHTETEGRALQELIEKCGNRYHVLNNKNRADGSQVTELLEKIEVMVAEKGGSHYEMDRTLLQEVEMKKRAVEKRVNLRMMKVQKQRKTLRALFEGEEYHLSELGIVLLGWRQSGKSSAGNTILGREEFESGVRTAQCVKRQGEVAGRLVTVINTPGWRHTGSVKYTAELDKQEIVRSVSLCPPGPCAFFLVINVNSAFRETHKRSVVEHLELLSERVWRHTIVLFTRGDWLGDTTIEQCIEAEGRALQELIEKCGNRYHVLNNKNRADGTQVTELLEKVEEMVARNKSVPFTIEERDKQGLFSEDKDKYVATKWRIFEEEWRRREDELIESMSKILPDPETEGSKLPYRKWRHSYEFLPPSLSGGTLTSSEAGSSVWDYESAEERSSKKVSSGYGTWSSAVTDTEMCDRMTLEEVDEALPKPTEGQLHELKPDDCVTFKDLKQKNWSHAAWRGEEHHLSELRIVLLGWRWSGKSSAGNTILGREEFESGIRTAQCVKRQGEVAGRLVTVIDTPGWWRLLPVNYTPEEIVRSVSLCPPGPCSFFLVINVSSAISEIERRSVVEHLKLLSERVWRHTIVLFTWGDWLGDIAIEQHIATEGRALQELIEKCGNRYHVLNNEDRADGSQVTELLEKVEDMVARNSSIPFTIEERDKQGLFSKVKDKFMATKWKPFEKEWQRREEELIERMSKIVFDSETEGSKLPYRKWRHSYEFLPPSLSGGTLTTSEAGSSVWDWERSRKKVSWWFRRSKSTSSASSGYITGSSAVTDTEMCDRMTQEEESDTPH